MMLVFISVMVAGRAAEPAPPRLSSLLALTNRATPQSPVVWLCRDKATGVRGSSVADDAMRGNAQPAPPLFFWCQVSAPKQAFHFAGGKDPPVCWCGQFVCRVIMLAKQPPNALSFVAMSKGRSKWKLSQGYGYCPIFGPLVHWYAQELDNIITIAFRV